MIERIFVFDSEERLWEICQQILKESIQWVAGTGHRPGVLLAGGGTYVPLYGLMGDIQADAFLTDERMVPPGTSSDTGAMLNREWFSHLVQGESSLFQVERLGDAASTAVLYEQRIQEWQRQGGVFAAALLGVGPDGHTASLFPGQKHLWESNAQLVTAAMGELDPRVERITCTPALFSRVIRHIVVLTGSAETDIAKRWLKEKEVLPISVVQPMEERFILLDRIAARDLDPATYELR